jgi:hypothetical protein
MEILQVIEALDATTAVLVLLIVLRWIMTQIERVVGLTEAVMLRLLEIIEANTDERRPPSS